MGDWVLDWHGTGMDGHKMAEHLRYDKGCVVIVCFCLAFWLR